MSFKVIAYSLLTGVLGASLVLVGWHLGNDHRDLHALVNLVVAQQQAAQKASQK